MNIEAIFFVEEMLQRRIRNDSAVPEMIGADLDHRQGRRQRPAGHNVFRSDTSRALSK
jgi:hypothetical protein